MRAAELVGAAAVGVGDVEVVAAAGGDGVGGKGISRKGARNRAADGIGRRASGDVEGNGVIEVEQVAGGYGAVGHGRVVEGDGYLILVGAGVVVFHPAEGVTAVGIYSYLCSGVGVVGKGGIARAAAHAPLAVADGGRGAELYAEAADGIIRPCIGSGVGVPNDGLAVGDVRAGVVAVYLSVGVEVVAGHGGDVVGNARVHARLQVEGGCGRAGKDVAEACGLVLQDIDQDVLGVELCSGGGVDGNGFAFTGFRQIVVHAACIGGAEALMRATELVGATAVGVGDVKRVGCAAGDGV